MKVLLYVRRALLMLALALTGCATTEVSGFENIDKMPEIKIVREIHNFGDVVETQNDGERQRRWICVSMETKRNAFFAVHDRGKVIMLTDIVLTREDGVSERHTCGT